MAIPVLLFALAFAVRVLTSVLFPDPAYPDSFYYVNVAQQLAAGNGLQVDYIWNFVDVGGRLPAQPGLPIPSNAHWMPLAAFVQVPFIWVLGATPLAFGLPFWLVGAAAAPLTYAIGRDAGLDRLVSGGAALLAAVPGGATPFLSQPDNFGLFMTLGALALWACGRAARGDRRAFALGGIAVGLATLSRSDGVLLGIPFALLLVADIARRPRLSRIGWRPAFAAAAAFLLTAGPWLVRQLAVFGSVSPSAANGRILFIRDYDQLYSISSDTSLGSFLAQGAGPLLASRADGLLAAMFIFGASPLLGYLVPFTVIGAWTRRHDVLFRPWLVYAAVLFAFSGLLFAVHVPHGTFLHSAVALLPHAYLATLLGVASVVGWIAARRRGWDAPRARRNFTVAALAFGVLASAALTLNTVQRWRVDRDARAPIVEALAAVPAGERVMSSDAGAYRYLAARPGIVTPEDPLPVIEQALRAYGVRWLVVERDHVVSALVPVLKGEQRPAWLSAPVVAVEPRAGPGVVAASTTERPVAVAALYAVCLEPGDDRCSH